MSDISILAKGSTTAMRVLTALDMENPLKVENASRQLWMQLWNRGLDITNEEIIEEALITCDISPQDSARYISMAKDSTVKNRLSDVTQEAIDAQAFGAPSYIIREEGKDDRLFFGQGGVGKKYFYFQIIWNPY